MDAQIKEFFDFVERKMVRRYVSYNEIASRLTPELIEGIAHCTTKKYSLLKLARLINASSRFDFWKKIFECRDLLTKEEFFQIWYRALNDRGSIFFQEVEVPFGKVAYFSNLHEETLLVTLPLTDAILIDNPSVKFRYTQVRKPGWKMVRGMMGRRWQTLRLPEMLRNSIEEDNPGKFNISRDMSGQKLSFSLLGEVMEKKAFKIFRMLLKEEELFQKVIPMDELCAHISGSYTDDLSVPLLCSIEEVFPGTLKEIRDGWGRNLLWYALHNRKTIWFHPKCGLTKCLLQYGCDPDNTNHLGLSWRYVTDNLSWDQKRQQMLWRYGTSRISWAQGNILRRAQPPEDVKSK